MSDYQTPQAPIDALLNAIRKPAHLLVAISGGSDSTGLLVLLHGALQSGLYPHISLSAATVDHRLRAASASEARQVAVLCARLGIAHVTKVWRDDKPAHGLSAAARQARYQLLCEAADEFGASAILSAHTADDQAETVAMRAARNASPVNSGLSGMASAVLLLRRHWLLRPLLACRRADIRTALDAAGIGWIDDPSNIDPAYERARIRASLAADGEQVFSDRGLQSRTALSQAAAAFLERHLSVTASVVASLSREALACTDRQTRRYALNAVAAAIGGRAHGLALEPMDRLLAMLDGGDAARMTAGRVVFDLRRDSLHMTRESRDILPLRIESGGEAIWDDRFRIRNGSGEALLIESAGQGADRHLFAGLPPAVARRASVALPLVRTGNIAFPLSAGGGGGLIEAEVFLGAYDRFLPLFDRKLANVLALRLGRGEYALPFHDLLTENAC
ncbi:tRNA lysidine(34) synthetase TilS [Rhizobium sp. LjRoot30]|uniref:tRNA lysidine(34) synthetase TilS n=1 Tax=Rhizobium sp. LjRoot30 TaxID=3342320 RepID=UPI003ECC77D2